MSHGKSLKNAGKGLYPYPYSWCVPIQLSPRVFLIDGSLYLGSQSLAPSSPRTEIAKTTATQLGFFAGQCSSTGSQAGLFGLGWRTCCASCSCYRMRRKKSIKQTASFPASLLYSAHKHMPSPCWPGAKAEMYLPTPLCLTSGTGASTGSSSSSSLAAGFYKLEPTE